MATLASFLAGCSPSGGQKPSHQVACEVATDYVGRFVVEAERLRTEYADAPRHIAVREAPYQLLPAITKDGPVEGDWLEILPEVADWRSVTKLSDESVLDACVGLKSSLSEQGVISNDERINSLAAGDEWDAHVLSIAMPVFTADQEQAVIFASKSTGGLQGAGILAIYSKGKNGEWRFVREEVRWMS
ncbi:hypothetical protein [Porphyrobacter sp. LM 6]|uniref:hypothetical protein n=1 Tax=Porphyrobacter sp. LM 6 TaxID=1896196 RepID=UPI001681BD51|nr:hypothetical protein [Porphyrobacter sp. LM 6]